MNCLLNCAIFLLFHFKCVKGDFEMELTKDEPPCILKKTQIDGDEVRNNFPSSSWKNCQEECQSSNECIFWTFFKNQETCTLFSTVKEKNPRNGAISGPKICSENRAIAANQTFSSRSSKSYITSPGYPNNYGNNVYTYWTVQAPNEYYSIHFKFLSLDIESYPGGYGCYDWVAIVDANGEVILPQLCGISWPLNLKSRTNKAYVVFYSDYMVTKKGFKLEVEIKHDEWFEPQAQVSWGNWGPIKKCSKGKYVVGVRQRIQANQGDGDDTALNAIRFTCSDNEVLISAEGNWGNWNSYVSNNYGFTGIRLKSESNQGPGKDNTAANGIQLKNFLNQIFYPGSLVSFGSWSDWVNCSKPKRITGFVTKVQPNQGNGDDTALNAVRILCD